jgi:hypothetical protein
MMKLWAANAGQARKETHNTSAARLQTVLTARAGAYLVDLVIMSLSEPALLKSDLLARHLKLGRQTGGIKSYGLRSTKPPCDGADHQAQPLSTRFSCSESLLNDACD